MASLTGQLVAETYKALLKTIDNDILTASEKQITDGFGGGSNVFIDSQGFLRANKYKVTNGLATQFLKADGSLDSNTYLTGITSSQIITALGYTPVTNARTLTINGTTYDLSANRSWTIAGTAAVWGNISGTLSNQTDLQTALNAKFNNPTGTISQYIRGDGTLATLPSAAVWGNITGTLSSQTDLQSALDAKFDDPTGNSTQYIDGSGNLQTFPTMLSSDNLIKLVRNQSGATITAGTIVYINGATGNKPTIAKALATSDATSAQTYGMVQADISNNADGYIVVIGNVNNLDTHSLTEGAQLYLSSTTAGTWTTTKQYAPAHLVYVGIVLRSHPNQGIIGVKIQNGYEMDELHDVSAQSPTNNDGLFFETSTGLWKNKSIATVLGYTPQAQLSGTGFVKASGTTISYDNSTYLTTTDAASTYQRLDKMVSNLLASATEYPNSNAVINALALKADALNPVFTGYMTISGAEPKLYFTDTDQNPDYFIGADAGFFRIYDQTAGATRFVINSSGVTTIAGDLIVGTIAKSGGTATQFLKADGSIDSSTYVTSASLANYLLISTAASTYQRLDKMVSNLLASDTEYPNSNAVLAKLALKADAANPVFTGDMTISGIAPKLYFTDTDNNPDYTLFVDSGYFYIYDQTAGATKFQITPSGNAINTGTLTSASFIKSGGTSSQYLMADGSVTTLTGVVTGSGTTNYLSKWTSGSVIGNSNISDNGSTVNVAINSLINGNIIGSQTNVANIIGGGFGTTTLSNNQSVTAGAVIGVYGGLYGFIDLAATADVGCWIDFSKGNGTDYAGRIRYDNLSDRFDFYTAGGATKVSISSAGNLLVNTTTDSGYKIETDGQIRSYSGSAMVLAQSSVAANDAVVAARWSSTSGIEMRYNPDFALTNFDSLYPATSGQVFGDIRFRVNSGGVMTPVMTIKANGTNVGIGTITPTEKLHVYSSATTGEIRLGGGNGAGNARMYFQAHATTAYIDMYGNNSYLPMQINANPLSFMGGYIGINTSSPSAYLHINGSAYSTGLLITTSSTSGADITLSNVGSGGKRWHITSAGSNNAIGAGGLQLYNETDEKMRLGITSGGNVLLNTTTSPTSGGFTNTTLLVKQVADGGAGGGLQIEASGSDNVAFFGFNGSAFQIGTSYRSTGSYQPIDFLTNGPVRMRLSTAGNLLIGTTTDAGYKLQVSGTATISGQYIQGGGAARSTNGSTIAFTGSSQSIWSANSDCGDGGRFLSIVNELGSTNAFSALSFRVNPGGGSNNAMLDMKFVNANSSNSSTLYWSFLHNGSFYDRMYLNSLGQLTATSFFESSDIRLKTLIDGSAQIAGIENLQAKLYEKNGKIELGYFAQDAEIFMPYAVSKNADGFLSLSYREVHTAKIARLEKEVEMLKAQLNAA